MWYFIFSVTVIFIYKDSVLSFFKYLKYQYKFWIFYAWLIIITTILIPVFALRPKNVNNALILAAAEKLIENVIGIEWQLRNSEVLSEDKAAVIVANHQYSLDILAFGRIWPCMGKAVVASKKELLYLGPIGLVLYLTGTIFIDRRRPKDAYKELQEQANKHFQNKTKILMFPEGTRNNDLTKLLPFKKGAFMLAVTSQVPIIPIVYSPYFFINNQKQIFNKGHIIIQCLEPISTKGLTIEDVPELREKVQNIVLNTYKELLREVTSTLTPDYPIEKQHNEK